MKKLLSVMLTLCLFVNVSFAAFDPYADEEVEKKSYKKLYYGIVLTLLGGFLAYDGFSMEEVDVSKPKVDYLTVSHSEWIHPGENFEYQIRSGVSINEEIGYEIHDYEHYKVEDTVYKVELNKLYNCGNVDLNDITIEVRYRFRDNTYIGKHGEHITEEGYHTAEINGVDIDGEIIYEKYDNITLKKGESITWRDVWSYTTVVTDQPNGDERSPYVPDTEPNPNDGTTGLNLGKDSPVLMDVRVKLNKYKQYKPIYEKRHKSDIEGVAGILIGITGIYFIVDHFLDMHKFNTYAKKHNLNLKFATASNEYKLLLQKRI